jgi:DNA-binding MarR family transcriptional regulator
MRTTADDRLMETAAKLRLAIVRTARRMRQEAGTDLTPTLAAALGTIERKGPITPSELADAERIKRPTATRTAAQLEERGLIVRAPDPADGRVSLLSISAEGRALLKRVRSRKNAYLARGLRDFDEEDLRTLDHAAEVLERLLEGDPR